MKIVSQPRAALRLYGVTTLLAVALCVTMIAIGVFGLKVPGMVKSMPTFRSWLLMQSRICVGLPVAIGVFWGLMFAVCRIASWDFSESGVEAKLAGFVWYRYGWDDIQCVCFTKASVILMTRRGWMRYLPFVGKEHLRDLVPLEKRRDYTVS